MWFWIVLLGLALIIVLFCFSFIKWKIYFSRFKDCDELYIDIKVFFGLVKYRYKVPTIKFEGFMKGIIVKTKGVNKNNSNQMGENKENITKERIQKSIERYKLILRNADNLQKWMKDILSHVICTEFRWDTRIGVGDAPETAITSGMVWGIKSSLLGYLFQYIEMVRKPHISVVPQYNSTQFSTEVIFIGQLRVGHALLAGVYLVIRILKVKGGFKAWQRAFFKAKPL